MTIDTKELRRLASRYIGISVSSPVSPQGLIELLDRLEVAEKERDFAKVEIARLHDDINELTDERDALQAKVEAMEQQEPECEVVGQVRNVLYEVRTLKYDLPAGAKLYALPGAQPAPSLASGDVSLISEGKTQPAPSVPDDILRDAMRYRFLRAAKHIPISTEAARDPIVYDAAIDAAMLAAAPEAKP